LVNAAHQVLEQHRRDRIVLGDGFIDDPHACTLCIALEHDRDNGLSREAARVEK
jgi:hypothetical protein